MTRKMIPSLLAFCLAVHALGDVGDPQIKTDHPWYPGELAMSTFERLFATQAIAYERATGRSRGQTDEDKALASWFWRNTHYWHAETGRRDLWGKGTRQGQGPAPPRVLEWSIWLRLWIMRHHTFPMDR